MSAERAGTPAVAIMTDAFVDGAALMARPLGADGYGFVVITHPIASAGDDDLESKARAAAAQAAQLLQG